MKVYKIEKLVTEFLMNDRDAKEIAESVGVSPATIDRLREEGTSLDNAQFGTVKKLYIAAKKEKDTDKERLKTEKQKEKDNTVLDEDEKKKSKKKDKKKNKKKNKKNKKKK